MPNTPPFARATRPEPITGLDLAMVLVPALLLAGLIAFSSQLFADGDSWWHVAAGRWMLDHGQVLSRDPFSYTVPGRAWHAHEWLSEVIMALAWKAGGWSAVALLFALALGSTAVLMGDELRRRMPPLSRFVALALVFSVMSPSLLARPHLLALPVLTLWMVVLLRAREQDRAPNLGWAALMTLWANLHGSFVLGLAIAAVFGLEALLAAPIGGRLKVIRAWGLFGALAGLASLVTPYGWDGWLFPLAVMKMKILPNILEWRAITFDTTKPFEVALLVVLFAGLSKGVRVPIIRLLLVLGLLHMTLHQRRQQVVLAAVSVLVLAEPFGRALMAEGAVKVAGVRLAVRGVVLAGIVSLVLLSGLRLATPYPRINRPSSPINALNHVPAELKNRPVLNEYGMGGYLIFQGVRPFIDGRADMYGDGFTGDFFAALRPDRARLTALLERWKVEWILLDLHNPAVSMVDTLPGWRRIYTDQISVVWVRAAPALSAQPLAATKVSGGTTAKAAPSPTQ